MIVNGISPYIFRGPHFAPHPRGFLSYRTTGGESKVINPYWGCPPWSGPEGNWSYESLNEPRKKKATDHSCHWGDRWNLSETLPHPIIMWVIEGTRSKVWMEVETPVKGSQDRWLIASVINQHLCSTVDIHSGHRWPALLLSNHLSSLLVFTSTPVWTLASSKEYSFSFKCRCTAGSYAAQVALLCCTKCLWSGCLVSPTSEHSSLHMLCCSTSVWCFLLGMNQEVQLPSFTPLKRIT